MIDWWRLCETVLTSLGWPLAFKLTIDALCVHSRCVGLCLGATSELVRYNYDNIWNLHGPFERDESRWFFTFKKLGLEASWFSIIMRMIVLTLLRLPSLRPRLLLIIGCLLHLRLPLFLNRLLGHICYLNDLDVASETASWPWWLLLLENPLTSMS